ncbi:hypothetical protein [Lysinibacillus endophyticus]|uniref:hypothetical protein n=1 Tax=Ureibacillus endophyticus TaxID=1978490 RepID=UPI00209FAAEB|nr:hypothetical protein [Lysinibacillus endophyticus]MCP1146153.1 hypothetical protein [Lysinibacillus endophyticus]
MELKLLLKKLLSNFTGLGIKDLSEIIIGVLIGIIAKFLDVLLNGSSSLLITYFGILICIWGRKFFSNKDFTMSKYIDINSVLQIAIRCLWVIFFSKIILEYLEIYSSII